MPLAQPYVHGAHIMHKEQALKQFIEQ